MIKAEIQVGTRTYVLEYPDVTSLEEAYNKTLAVATGQKISKGPKGWLDLNKKDYDHIKVYFVEDNPLAGLPFGNVLPPNITPAPLENPAIVKRRLDYLGQRLEVEVATYADGESVYVLPYKVNGQPAVGTMGTGSLIMLIEEFAQKQGYQPYEGVLPHGPIIDDQEALAFVKDYAEETEAAREKLLRDTDKTARGFTWPNEK
jgi:hypothetical protein